MPTVTNARAATIARELFGPGWPQPGGDVDHVQAAGEEIEQADADDVEGRTDRTHDQILERGQQRAPIMAERDQHVGRER